MCVLGEGSLLGRRSISGAQLQYYLTVNEKKSTDPEKG